MRQISSLYRKSLLFALALSLMLGVGVCRPAATASAEGPLAEHKDEIVDAIVQAREDLRSTLEDLRAIRDEVKAREAAKAEEQAETLARGLTRIGPPRGCQRQSSFFETGAVSMLLPKTKKRWYRNSVTRLQSMFSPSAKTGLQPAVSVRYFTARVERGVNTA